MWSHCFQDVLIESTMYAQSSQANMANSMYFLTIFCEKSQDQPKFLCSDFTIFANLLHLKLIYSNSLQS